MDESNKYYSIGEVSSICDVSIKTLRYYDDIGLLVPEGRNPDSKYRYYKKEQMLTLSIIKKLRFLGLSIKDIKTIVYESDTTTFEMKINERLNEIQKIIEEFHEKQVECKFLLSKLQEGRTLLDCYSDGPSDEIQGSVNDVNLEYIPESDVIFTRRIQKDYANVEVSLDRWFEVFKMAANFKSKIVGNVILTYHNYQLEQFFNKDCDLEVCVPVREAKDKKEFKKFGGFNAVTTLHIGTNATMIDTHIKAIKWLNKNDLMVAGPISELYIISPIDIKNESEHITKVIIPVEKKKI